MDVQSVAPLAQEESPELVGCFRHKGEDCPHCDGSGFRPRRYCEGCGEPSGKPSEGGRPLVGLKNAHGKDQPMYCLNCHPEFRGTCGDLAMLERMGG